MKSTVKKIDHAIRDLYRLDLPFSATDFIMNLKGIDESRLPHGSLFVQEEKEDLSLGIFLHPNIQKTLISCESLEDTAWTSHETNAFATAAEEISHFIYLIYHANQGRSVSQFELELQGEIDKFLVLFFKDKQTLGKEKFESLYETVFHNYRWHPLVTPEQKERYENANGYAKKFVAALREYLCQKERYPELMKRLREYYRLGSAEKIGYLHKD